MRACNAKGCNQPSVGTVRTKQGAFDVCIHHEAVLTREGEIAEPSPVIAIVAEKVKPTGRPPLAISAETKAQIATMAAEGHGARTIAAATGLNRSTVKRRLNAGIDDAPETPNGDDLDSLAARFVAAGKRLAEGAAKVREGERIVAEAREELRRCAAAIGEA